MYFSFPNPAYASATSGTPHLVLVHEHARNVSQEPDRMLALVSAFPHVSTVVSAFAHVGTDSIPSCQPACQHPLATRPVARTQHDAND